MSPKRRALVDDEALDLVEERRVRRVEWSTRKTRPGAMKRNGGVRPVIARICTGEVCVRSTWPPSTKNVSCESRDGWSAAMRSASKLFHSRLDLGPVLDREAQAAEELAPSRARSSVTRMQRAARRRRARQRRRRARARAAPRSERARSSARSRSAASRLDARGGAVQRLARAARARRARARRCRAAARETEPLRPRKRARASRSSCSDDARDDRLARLALERVELRRCRWPSGPVAQAADLASVTSSENAFGSATASSARILRSISTPARLSPRDEAAVREPVLARRRVDARDPQAVELALALAPVAVRVDEALLDREARRAG